MGKLTVTGRSRYEYTSFNGETSSFRLDGARGQSYLNTTLERLKEDETEKLLRKIDDSFDDDHCDFKEFKDLLREKETEIHTTGITDPGKETKSSFVLTNKKVTAYYDAAMREQKYDHAIVLAGELIARNLKTPQELQEELPARAPDNLRDYLILEALKIEINKPHSYKWGPLNSTPDFIKELRKDLNKISAHPNKMDGVLDDILQKITDKQATVSGSTKRSDVVVASTCEKLLAIAGPSSPALDLRSKNEMRR